MNRIRTSLQCKGINYCLRQDFSHLILQVDQKEQALSALSKIFGISSYSVVEHTVPSKLNAIVEVSRQMISVVEGKTFAVRARRTGGADFTTPEVERAVGAVLSPHGKVDLGDPQRVIYVETINHQTYIFSQKIPGARGLPLNHRERSLVLLSGGFDSAVAAWHMMKRGVACDYLFCNMGGKFHQRQALQVAKVLHEIWARGSSSTFFSVDFHPVVSAIKERANSYRQVLLKRQMYRVAEKVAISLNSKAIVVGDSLGQVTSQSLQNIKVIDGATTFPVLRPLVGLDKEEIIALSYRIGTGLLSEKVVELCGISKGQPVTNAKHRQVLAMEGDLPAELSEQAYRSQCRLELSKADADSLRSPYLLVKELDREAQIIDCQESGEQKLWSVPNSLHIPFEELRQNYRSLDRGKKYILYCRFGSKTPYAAEIMQQAGYEAYAFEGGVGQVKKTYQLYDLR